MAMNDRIRYVGKAATTATAAAPYVRRLVRDEELRESLREFARTVDHLYNRLTDDGSLEKIAKDAALRRDVDRMVGVLQKSALRVTKDTRRRSRSALYIGAGLGALAIGIIAAALLYPRTRSGMARVVTETRQRAVSTASEARERISQVPREVRRAA